MRTLLLLSVCLALAVPAGADEVKFNFSVRSRVEAWDWFGDDPGGQYGFSGNLIRFGWNSTGKKLDWTAEFAAPVLLGLPSDAVLGAPRGVLGVGGNYFVGNQRNQNAAMVFLKQGFVRVKMGKSASLRLGRYEFLDGSEVAPADPVVAALKRDRIQQRLLGHFGWTHVGRSFDGGQVLGKAGPWTLTSMAAVPTRGVFQTDGWGWNRAMFTYSSATRATGKEKSVGEVRLFHLYYHDGRAVLKTDNRPAALRAADLASIGIHTYGAHYIHSFKTAAGNFDAVLWGTLQNGTWGPQDHRAGAVDLEVGYQVKGKHAARPWIRGGYYRGTGDKDAGDNVHGTFFQILPTPRPYAKTPFFNMMNSDDRFVTVASKLHPKVNAVFETHWLGLASRRDLWYLGGGVFQPWSFGYIGRPANGQDRLGRLTDISLDVTLNKRWSVSGYFGHTQAGRVIQAIYPRQSNGLFGYAEVTFKY
jgi:hypothetical protein